MQENDGQDDEARGHAGDDGSDDGEDARDDEPEQRMEFVATMMPRCLNIVFSELGPEARERVARDMIEQMTAIAQENLPPGETASAGETPDS